MRDYTQLTQEERYQIEALLKMEHHQSEIAVVLKRHKSTSSREVSRSPVLLTLAERRTRYSIIAKAPDKSAQAVTDALLTVLQPHAGLVHTLTYDNGKEFAYHQTVAKGLDAQGDFAHPYHSWERGLNKNTNGLIRHYLPKGTDFHSRARRSAMAMASECTVKCPLPRTRAGPPVALYELNPRIIF